MASNSFDAMIQDKLNALQDNRAPRHFHQPSFTEGSTKHQPNAPRPFLGARPPHAPFGTPKPFDQGQSMGRSGTFPSQSNSNLPRPHMPGPPRAMYSGATPSSKTPTFQCRKCNSMFPSKAALHTHLVAEQHFDTHEPASSAPPPSATNSRTPAVAMSPNHPFYQQARESQVINKFQSLKQRMAARGPPRRASRPTDQHEPQEKPSLSAHAPGFQPQQQDIASQSGFSADESDGDITSQASFLSEARNKSLQRVPKAENVKKPPSPTLSLRAAPLSGQPLARTSTVAPSSVASPLVASEEVSSKPGHFSFNKHDPPVSPVAMTSTTVTSPRKANKHEKPVVLATIDDDDISPVKQKPKPGNRESPSIIADSRGFVSSKFTSSSPAPSALSPMPDEITLPTDIDDEDEPHIDGQVCVCVISSSLKIFAQLVGTCTDMCPLDEIKRRYEQNDIKDLEWPDDGDKSLAALRKTMIKQYQRSAADHNLSIPQHVRDPR